MHVSVGALLDVDVNDSPLLHGDFSGSTGLRVRHSLANRLHAIRMVLERKCGLVVRIITIPPFTRPIKRSILG